MDHYLSLWSQTPVSQHHHRLQPPRRDLRTLWSSDYAPSRTFTWTLEYPLVTFLTLRITFDILGAASRQRCKVDGMEDNSATKVDRRNATAREWKYSASRIDRWRLAGSRAKSLPIANAHPVGWMAAAAAAAGFSSAARRWLTKRCGWRRERGRWRGAESESDATFATGADLRVSKFRVSST